MLYRDVFRNEIHRPCSVTQLFAVGHATAKGPSPYLGRSVRPGMTSTGEVSRVWELIDRCRIAMSYETKKESP